jgi:outer membrane receptor protein involved in Fe transport
MKNAQKQMVALMVAVLSLGLAQAQTPTPAAKPEKLNEVVVRDVPVEESIMPTERPLLSLFGTEKSILDTPRNVTSISKAQLEETSFTQARNLNQYSSGVYTPSTWGLQGVPYVRGDIAEVYVNGQRRAGNQNAYPFSYNSVESIGVGKGPGSVVFGPGAQSGGTVLITSKTPYFDKLKGEVSLNIGAYVPGGMSYFSPTWQLDVGGPLIKDKLAFRMSYLGKAGDNFYKGTKDDREDFYLALTATPYDNLTFETNGVYFSSNTPEIGGINRVTQQMIDHRYYYSGSNVTYTSFPGGVPTPGTPGIGFLPVLNPSGIKKIYPNEVLVDQGDSANQEVGYGQFIVTLKVSDDLTIKNSSFGESVDRRKLSNYSYYEDVPKANTLENRTEVNFKFDTVFGSKGGGETMKDPKDAKSLAAVTKPKEDPTTFKNEIVAGYAVRYEERQSLVEFFNEFYPGPDITLATPFPRPAGAPAGLFNSYLVNTTSGTTFANPGVTTSGNAIGNHDTANSQMLNPSLFYQHSIDFTPQWNLLLGVRGDYYQVSANDPVHSVLDGTFTPVLTNYRDTASFGNIAYSSSLSYKPTPDSTMYATYNHVNAVQGSFPSGAISLSGTSPGTLNPNDFHNLSEMYEAGYKFTALNGAFYGQIDGFYQTRVRQATRGSSANIEIRGVEIEGTYQPTRAFDITANATWQEGNYNNFSPAVGTYSVYDLYALGTGPDGKGTGKGANSFGTTAPKGDYKMPGLPNILFNARATYRLPCGLGFSVGPQVQGPQLGDFNTSGQGQQIKIPAQYTWNGAIFYVQPRYEIRADFSNFTDERNFTVNDPTGSSTHDLITMDQPLSISGQIKYKF